MSNNLMPDFLIIGAGKSGTTSLDNYLKQHPQLFVSPIKEPNFFAYEQVIPESIQHDKTLYEHYLRSTTDLEAYKKLFVDAPIGLLKGETSNTYLYNETARFRIKHYIPNVKLIAIFRQPSDRLYSRYLHLARENKLPTENFADALDKRSIWWQRYDLVQEGFYYRHLSQFYELFPAENIRVYLYEDLIKQPINTMQDIFMFLGVDENFVPDLSVRYNQSGFIKNRLYDKFIGQDSIVKKSIEKINPSLVSQARENIFLQKIVTTLRAKNLSRPKVDKEIRNKLTAIYKDDILSLQKLINRDLSHWLL